jgi:hypothetical protein
LVEAAEKHPGATIQQWEASPNVLASPALTGFLRSISPRYMTGHPTVPVFHYHDATDEFAPLAPALQTMQHWCEQGTKVQEHVVPVGEHILYESLGEPAALHYLADRFADKPAPGSCPPP